MDKKIKEYKATWLWAVKIIYLESQYTGDGKWHQKTTHWYEDSNKAWEESEEFLNKHNKKIVESSGSLIHKSVIDK